MATRPKAVIESRNGEKLSPITIAKNVLTDDGQNLHDILSDRKEDMMTPTIENSSSMFKVGQGDDVDYSSNVVNGAYEDMVLKGKSMVNSIQEPSSQDVVLPYEFNEGQYVTINDTKESGALGVELKGQTLVNLISINRVSITSGASYAYPYNIVPTIGKKYLIKVKIKSVGESTNSLPVKIQPFNSSTAEGYFNITSNDYFVGNEITKIITCIDGDNIKNGKFTIWCRDLSSGTFECDIVMLEYQEGMENWVIPYIEGMASCKMPILHTVGNNIIKNSSVVYAFENLSDTNTLSTSTQLSLDANYKQMLRGKEVTISVDAIGENLAPLAVNGPGYNHYGVDISVVFEDGTNQWLSLTKGNGLPSNGSFNGRYYRTFTVLDKPIKQVAPCQLFCRTTVGRLRLTNVQLEIRNTNSNYEPYKSNTLSLPEEVVLRSLPNGVRDTFNTRTGVYTQRIGEVVLNGTESWKAWESNDTHCKASLAYYPADMSTNGEHTTRLICDKLKIISDRVGVINDNFMASVGDAVYSIVVGLELSKLASADIAGLKQWLSQNPITVQYQLENPIVTKINLPSTLKSWNTTTHIYSEISENTLYPILSHSNPTYPVILKPSTKYSIVANSYSNNHTNSTINFNLGGATASTTVGNRITTITTPSTLSNELLTMGGRGNKLNNVMVIKGDVVGDEPYFEGICDCKSPILSNVGKNLFDINNHTKNQWSFSSGYPYEQNTSYGDRLKILGDEIHFSTDGGTLNKGVGYYIPLCKNKDYTFRINKKDGNGNYCVKLFLIHSSEHPLKKSIQQHSKFGINNETISSSLEANFNSANYDMCAIYIGGGWESGTQTTRSYVFNNISLTESNQQVEPYKSNTTTFNQKGGKTIVLRSLPSGVCDTLNVETGEYVQRIGEVVLDGSGDEQWSALTPVYFDNLLRWKIGLPRKSTVSVYRETSMVCDRVKVVNYAFFADRNYEFVSIHENGVDLQLMLEKSKAATVAELKEYLQQHPTIVQYELATPIVSTIDVQGFPYAYTNGHVQLSSGSIEQSLTPKVEYSVVTNRNGQIRSNQKMVERHQKQLDRLQAMILANLVNTQYEQTLTNLKYDLKNVREEVK